MITTKSKDLEDDTETKSDASSPSIDVVDSNKTVVQEEEIPVKDEQVKPVLMVNGDNSKLHNGTRSDSPSAKILKDVLAEEVPQYKRYVDSKN